jgi:nucleoside-diphosphate-sugar epimerase
MMKGKGDSILVTGGAGFVDDLVRAMRLATEKIDSVAGEVFNLGGGHRNAVSVRGVIERLRNRDGGARRPRGAGAHAGSARGRGGIRVAAAIRDRQGLGLR